MPPKAAAKSDKGPSKKTEQKKKEKVIEDKTFGLKNKKGTKQQKFIQHVQKQTMQGNVKASKLAEMAKTDGKKDLKKKEAEQLNMLFKPVEQKIGKGADPKSVLCAFFKQGQCQKGAKCKFSHDLNIGRKAEKRNMYDEDEKKKGTMDEWDEEQLQDVVNQKHGEKNKSLPPTSIICKHFLDAVENNKYGWFWECPGGPKCHYRHALPPGFVLKKDKKALESKKEEISLEELIERERAALNSQNLTKVTLESFLKWKQRKRDDKKKRADDDKKKKKADFKQGRILGISGREMFEFNPDMMGDDEGEEGEDALAQYKRQDLEEEVEGPIREINLDSLENDEMEIDQKLITQKDHRVPQANGVGDDEEGKLEVAGAIPPSPAAAQAEAAISAAMAATVNGDTCIDTPIDENLFDGDDIDFVEDELDELELDD